MENINKTKEQLLNEIDKLRIKIFDLEKTDNESITVDEALRKSEAMFNESQRLTQIGSWELDLILNTLYWSDEIYRMFDLDPGQFGATYEAFLDNIHPDDREMVNKAYTESVKNKKPYNIVHRLLLKDGTLKFVNERCETFYNDQGNAIRSLGTIQDITERKSSEDALVKSNSLLNSVIESPENIIMFALDTNYNYLGFNKAHVKEMKSIYDADIEIGQHIFSYMPNENDRLKAEKNYKRVLKGERFIEIQEYGEADSRFWYELIFNPITDTTQNVTGFTVFVTNITERKQVEIELHKSESKFKALVINNEEIIYSIDKDGTFLLSEGKGLLKLGLKPGQVVGQSVFDLYKDFPDMLNEMRRALDGETITSESKVGDNYFRNWYTPQKNQKGDIIGLLGLSVNINEQKQSEEELMQSLNREKTQADIIRTTPIAIAFGYPDGSLDNCNKAFSELTGYSEEELKNISWNEVLTPQKWNEIETKALEKLGPENNSIQYEKEYIHKSGNIIPIELVVTAKFDDDKNLLYFIGFISDITERKQVENEVKETAAKWKTTFDAISDSVSIIDLNGNITICNSATNSMFNIKEDDLKKNYCYQLVHGIEEPYPNCPLVRMKKSKVTETMIFKEGNRWLKVTVNPILNSLGELTSAVHIVSDITNTKNTEEELILHQKNLEEMVNERTKELEEKNKELDNALKVFVGRELTIKNLQERIRALGGK